MDVDSLVASSVGRESKPTDVPMGVTGSEVSMEEGGNIKSLSLEVLRKDHSLLRKLTRTGISNVILAPCIDATAPLRRVLSMQAYGIKTTLTSFKKALFVPVESRTEEVVARILEFLVENKLLGFD